jgi:hypothetical protein
MPFEQQNDSKAAVNQINQVSEMPILGKMATSIEPSPDRHSHSGGKYPPIVT